MVGKTWARIRNAEQGSEILQLALALPILLLLFGITAQAGIWVFSAIQLADAAESVAYDADLDKLIRYQESGSEDASSYLAQEIASRMVGTDASRLAVTDVTTETSSFSQSAPIDKTTTNGVVTRLTRTETTGTLAFTVSYRCPTLVAIGEPLTIEGRWTRDRLVNRKAEVE